MLLLRGRPEACWRVSLHSGDRRSAGENAQRTSRGLCEQSRSGVIVSADRMPLRVAMDLTTYVA
jgi:hypothetical protein